MGKVLIPVEKVPLRKYIRSLIKREMRIFAKRIRDLENYEYHRTLDDIKRYPDWMKRME